MGYTPRAWGQVKMMFIPAIGKVNSTQAKAYCPSSQMSFMRKMMQKFQTRNIRVETLWDFKCIIAQLMHSNISNH